MTASRKPCPPPCTFLRSAKRGARRRAIFSHLFNTQRQQSRSPCQNGYEGVQGQGRRRAEREKSTREVDKLTRTSFRPPVLLGWLTWHPRQRRPARAMIASILSRKGKKKSATRGERVHVSLAKKSRGRGEDKKESEHVSSEILVGDHSRVTHML